MTIVAIVPAAGAGKRLGTEIPKAFLEVAGRSIFSHTIGRLDAAAEIARYVVPIPSGMKKEAERLRSREMTAGVIEFVEGGANRTRSVAAALARVGQACELVLVHDAVRPLVEPEVVRATIEAARRTGAAIAAAPCTDTVKEADRSRVVRKTLPREGLWLVQTPQAFRVELLRRAYDEAERLDLEATDDSALVERLGTEVRIVPSSPLNLKITTAPDLEFFRMKLRRGG